MEFWVMTKLVKTQNGFGLMVLFILIAAIVLAFLIGERVYSARKAVRSVQDFAQCIKTKGSKLLETSPEQCVLDGKVFINVISPPTDN